MRNEIKRRLQMLLLVVLQQASRKREVVRQTTKHLYLFCEQKGLRAKEPKCHWQACFQYLIVAEAVLVGEEREKKTWQRQELTFVVAAAAIKVADVDFAVAVPAAVVVVEQLIAVAVFVALVIITQLR